MYAMQNTQLPMGIKKDFLDFCSPQRAAQREPQSFILNNLI